MYLIQTSKMVYIRGNLDAALWKVCGNNMCGNEKLTPPITDGTPGLVHQCVKEKDHEGNHQCHDACDYGWED
jgi:hypothetical protein